MGRDGLPHRPLFACGPLPAPPMGPEKGNVHHRRSRYIDLEGTETKHCDQEHRTAHPCRTRRAKYIGEETNGSGPTRRLQGDGALGAPSELRQRLMRAGLWVLVGWSRHGARTARSTTVLRTDNPHPEIPPKLEDHLHASDPGLHAQAPGLPLRGPGDCDPPRDVRTLGLHRTRPHAERAEGVLRGVPTVHLLLLDGHHLRIRRT